MIAANAPVPLLMGGVEPELLEPPVNVMRLSLHPGGLAPRIANLESMEARTPSSDCGASTGRRGDKRIEALLSEISGYRICGRGTE